VVASAGPAAAPEVTRDGASDGANAPPAGTEDAQRRVVRTLVATQALGGVGVTTGIAVSSLLAAEIVDSDTLSGLPQTAQVVGAALMAFVLARVMDARGRRPGLALGYVVGLIGGALCIWSAVAESFSLLLLGTLMLGSATAVNSLSRYAATDLAQPSRRARALSVVVWATTLGAVLGPNLVGPAGDLAVAVGMPELAGPYAVGLVGLVAAALVMVVWLRPDPLLLAREQAVRDGSAPDAVQRRTGVVAAGRIVAANPRAMASIAAIAAAHTVMVSVMVMTPLHMHHGGAELDIIGFVISVHILGMFAFSPLVGWMSDRFGRSPVLVLGGLTLIAAVLLAGTTDAGPSSQLTVGLFLLGLGWSFALIGSSALLVDVVPLRDRPSAQGFSDLLMGLAAAGGGAVAGVVVDVWGYDALNAGAGVLALVVLAAAWAGRGSIERPPTVVAEPAEA
jgi:MFS family permease